MTQEEWDDLFFFGYWMAEEKRRIHNMIPFSSEDLFKGVNDADPKNSMVRREVIAVPPVNLNRV